MMIESKVYMPLETKQNLMRVTYLRFKITKLKPTYVTKCTTNDRQQCLKGVAVN